MKSLVQLRLIMAGVVASAMASSAFAVGPDFSSLTASVNFDSTTTSVLAVGAALAGLFIVLRGVKIILPLIRG